MRLLIITSVEKEARAIAPHAADGVVVVVSGVGRTNAAAATTEAILQRGPFDQVMNAGIAGALPESELKVGDALVASACVYYEEGLITASGFGDMSAMGLSLGNFEGNTVPVDERLLEKLSEVFPIGPIATVATCSGTDAAAREVVRRTSALAEAMEGAAVVHAARRLRVPAIELRVISNMTGDRARQTWDLERGIEALGAAVSRAIQTLRK